ncbi:sensor histidine kinase [Lapillicoccus sp.]|uniref:sensor histidine kinase n=1 Tax=Lapillicoccus sp. TaxID=1909287 RepID=UPI0039834192
MRRQLVRSTFLAVLVAVLVTGAPAALFGTWLVSQRPDLLDAWMAQAPSTRGLEVFLGVSLLAAAVISITVLVAARQSRRLADPMIQLAEAAERLGAGQSRLEPMRSGIPEVDRVSNVLSRSAQQVTKTLAAERDFASDASHQLRTPLTALLMRLEEISDTDDPEVVKEEAGIAIDQVERLTRVVDDLLMRSRRSNDAPRPEVSLDSVIAALQREWQPAFEEARRSVHVHGERGLVVKATPVALSQVLSTLFENSLVHGRGTVEVQARRSGPSVVVEVSDQGEGVPSNLAPHIFERSVSSGQGTSTGLGLALARDLAESNGGRLDLISAQPARFALFLSEADQH